MQLGQRSLAARLVVASVLLVSLVTGCGGGSDDATPPPVNVGPAGATITSADGNATLVVPAGALDRSIHVAIAPASGGAPVDPLVVPGTVYAIDAPDIDLALPATLTIAGPAGAASGVAASRVSTLGARPQAILEGPDPIVCNNGASVGHPVFPETQCLYWDQLVDSGHCPAQLPIYFGSFTLILDNVSYPVTGCESPAAPILQLAALPPGTLTVLPSTTNPDTGTVTTTLAALHPGSFGLVGDHTPPVVELTMTVTPTTGGKGTVTLSAVAHDDVGVAKVTFQRWVYGATHTTFAAIDLDTDTSPPYVWTSPEIPLDQIYYYFYAAVARDAAGNRATSVKSTRAPGAVPTIPLFVATPAALPVGGGNTLLSWTTQDATALSVDQGVGDVTGLTSKAVHVTATTTFVLTATNAQGNVTRAATVTVTPQPAPAIASFSAAPAALPAGGGNVTLSWTASDADTLSIDHGIGVVTGTSVVVPVTTNTTFTLTASNSTGSITKQSSVTVASVGDLYVDVAVGVDTNPCSQAAPCKTISKGATGAPSGATVWLGDGVYPTSQGTATLPDGVGLRAIHPGAATIAGISIHPAGSSAIRDIVLDLGAGFSCGQIFAQSTTGTPAVLLDGVLIKCIGAVVIAGNVNATMTPGALAGGVYTQALPNGSGAMVTVQGNATMLIQGGTIDGNNTGAAAFGGGLISVNNTATLTLSGVTMQNRTEAGIAVAATSTLVVKDNSVFDHVGIAGNCPVGSVIVTSGAVHVTLDHVQISNSPGAGLCVRNTPGQIATISLTATTMNANAFGIAAETGSGSAAVLTATGLSLTGNTSYGIYWEGTAGSAFDIANSTITGNGIGLQFADAGGALKLRNSNVSSNTNVGFALFNNASADLGTQASPGGNTITGNVNAGVKTNLNAGHSFTAVGNTWNANAQGASASGRYSVAPAWTPVPLSGPTISGPGINVSMPANNSASL